MDRARLCDRVAQSTGVPVAHAELVLDCALNTIAEQLAAGRRVTLQGFGTFALRHAGRLVTSRAAEPSVEDDPALPAFVPAIGLRRAVRAIDDGATSG